MAKICCVVLMVLCGCSAAGQLDTKTFLAEVDKLNQPVVSKIDSNTETLAEIQSSINTFTTKQLELDERIVSLLTKKEASLVNSDPENGKEVIKSKDTSPDDIAQDSQTPAQGSSAESGGVPLFVSVSPYCPPCHLMKKHVREGKLNGFDVTWCVLSQESHDKLVEEGISANDIQFDTWQPYFGNPGIRYQTADSPTGWAIFEPHGYSEQIRLKLRAKFLGEPLPVASLPATPVMQHQNLVSLHNQLHGGGSWTWPGDLASHLRDTHGVQTGAAPVGAIFPSGAGNQVVSSRYAVRSFPQRTTYRGRSSFVSRSSCPPGGCP